MEKLPKPQNRNGYPISQVNEILKELKVNRKDFDKAFGINTCMSNPRTGETILFRSDVERALYILNVKLGKNHTWD